jgi:hypothetical protein
MLCNFGQSSSSMKVHKSEEDQCQKYSYWP